MLIAIDGTGPLTGYDEDFKGSFCNQICNTHPLSHYIEGPWDPGMTLGGRLTRGITVLRDFYFEVVPGYQGQSLRPRRERINHPVHLAGYSRGGAAVIQLARQLGAGTNHIACMSPAKDDPVFNTFPYIGQVEQRGIIRRHALANPQSPRYPIVYYTFDVDALFLFDPVNKDAFLPDLGIPANVKNAYVLLRDQKIEHVNASTLNRDIYARKWMENSKLNLAGATKMPTPQVITGASHGAAGGVPWVTRAADEAATNRAGAWMTQHLNRHGINVKLQNKYPFPKPEAPTPKPAPTGVSNDPIFFKPRSIAT